MNKNKSINYYCLPLRFYPKYNPILILLYLLVNYLSIFFLTHIFDINSNDELSIWIFAIFSLIFILTVIYFDIDFIHSILKMQYIEITNEHIRIKKLRADKTFNWRDIKSIDEMYSIRFQLLTGVKIKLVDNKKNMYFLNTNCVIINFNKYDGLDREEFLNLINRKASNAYRMRF